MKPSTVPEHLRKSRVDLKKHNTPEKRVIAFLNDLAHDPHNFEGHKATYSYLMGASTLLNLIELKEPEAALDAWQKAFSRRGGCIFERRPPKHALSRMMSLSAKTPRGRAVRAQILKHSNDSIRKWGSRLDEKPLHAKPAKKQTIKSETFSDMSETRVQKLRADLREFNTRHEAIVELKGNPSAVEACAQELGELLYKGDPIAKAHTVKLFGENPKAFELALKKIPDLGSRMHLALSEDILHGLRRHPDSDRVIKNFTKSILAAV